MTSLSCRADLFSGASSMVINTSLWICMGCLAQLLSI